MYTMNISEPQMNECYRGHIEAHEAVLPMIFSHAESLFSNETLPFEDYDRGGLILFRSRSWKGAAQDGLPGGLQAGS